MIVRFMYMELHQVAKKNKITVSFYEYYIVIHLFCFNVSSLLSYTSEDFICKHTSVSFSYLSQIVYRLFLSIYYLLVSPNTHCKQKKNKIERT